MVHSKPHCMAEYWCSIDSQHVYMTLKKVELLAQIDYDWITKMHVYTLVKLKSNRIGLLIVELRHLDNLIRSRAKCAYLEWDWVTR